MPYARFTDRFHVDRHARKLTLNARGMLLTAHTYCADQLTDGFVPSTFLDDHGRGRMAKRAIAELVEKGWWVAREDGYESVTYLQDNPPRDEVEERLERSRKRQERYAARRRQRQLPWDEPGEATA